MKTKKKISILVLFAFLSCLNYGAFAQGMKIVSPHPDLKFKITRCEAAGNTVIIDFIIENVSPRDVDLRLNSGQHRNLSGGRTVAYDDEGNKITGNRFKVQLADSKLIDWGEANEILPSEIPIKGRFQLEGVPETANSFKRIDVDINSDALGIPMGTEKRLRITNLPIYREGDE